MQAILGRPGRIAMTAAILVSTFGCVNGIVLAGARVYYAMARDGLFFRHVGTVNRHHVPSVALIAQGLWAALLTLPRTVSWDEAGSPKYGNGYSKLLEYVMSADLTFAALMVAAVIVLRLRRRDADRPFRTPGFPLPALVFLTLAVLLLADFLYLNPATSGVGFLFVLTGLPVYALWRRLGN
jgi:APA family basic amino acid/polyamine antiporter